MTVQHVHIEDRPNLHRRNHAGLNHLVLGLLRSPLHHLLDTELCELSYRAPVSGRDIDLPVMYAADGTDLVVMVGDAPEKAWWRAFRQPYPLEIRRGGAVRAGTGRVLAADDPRYARAIAAYKLRHGINPVLGDRVILVEHLTPAEGTA